MIKQMFTVRQNNCFLSSSNLLLVHDIILFSSQAPQKHNKQLSTVINATGVINVSDKYNPSTCIIFLKYKLYNQYLVPIRAKS